MATAKIYDAELDPTKDEMAARFSSITQLDGTYRAYDRDDKVGIEVLVGRDEEGNLTQCGLSYREEDMALDDVLTPLTHSVLGRRSVAQLTADPVAVREFVELIVNGGQGADFSTGEPIFGVRGTGGGNATVDDVEIETHDKLNSVGTLTVDGEEKRYQLRLQRIISALPTAENGDLALVREDGAILMNLGLWD
ncbi:hypothetical protein SAMN05444817_1049 [Corynebacterium appendicis CIP 107643]|uniref:Maltokinase N-terminal cap domain-containing protein n=1 Tax=Corynebacterium appendicis CIP 107643 TaxID=1161099 RepID=A0A1N7J5V2_9CORY|nr:hypothetical protein [Corynebacterium appendicis]WJY61789.1 hypothetical protein CAPP_09495 [Corynebacterium appendicis CIP 107643]SIS44621.1 hypothetical protein SAMN05444817_1049 [Corynebacterium appendicis CIP 107643]